MERRGPVDECATVSIVTPEGRGNALGLTEGAVVDIALEAPEEAALVLAGVVLLLSTLNGGVKLFSEESLSETISTV